MVISNRDVYNFLILKGPWSEESINVLKQLPILIRTNGLTLTLEYLNYKDSEEHSRILYVLTEKINDYFTFSRNFTKLLLELRAMSNSEYMFLQKEMYSFSVKAFVLSTALLHKNKSTSTTKYSNNEKNKHLGTGYLHYPNKDNLPTITINPKNTDVNYYLTLNKYISFGFNKKDKTAPKISDRDFEKKDFKFVDKRFEILNKIFKPPHYKQIIVHAVNTSNLIIGHGEVSIREVSIKLDYTYGVPLIPASSIKGAFKNYLEENNIFQDCKNNIEKIFGTKTDEGNIIFTDAYPVESCTVTRDVMTPHYSDYYMKESGLPNDSQSPVPILFPVIKSGSKFKFKLFVKTSENLCDIENLFKEFITNGALGAKSSVGYGYFEIFKQEGRNGK